MPLWGASVIGSLSHCRSGLCAVHRPCHGSGNQKLPDFLDVLACLVQHHQTHVRRKLAERELVVGGHLVDAGDLVHLRRADKAVQPCHEHQIGQVHGASGS